MKMPRLQRHLHRARHPRGALSFRPFSLGAQRKGAQCAWNAPSRCVGRNTALLMGPSARGTRPQNQSTYDKRKGCFRSPLHVHDRLRVRSPTTPEGKLYASKIKGPCGPFHPSSQDALLFFTSSRQPDRPRLQPSCTRMFWRSSRCHRRPPLRPSRCRAWTDPGSCWCWCDSAWRSGSA
jgi:hypothetical protein